MPGPTVVVRDWVPGDRMVSQNPTGPCVHTHHTSATASFCFSGRVVHADECAVLASKLNTLHMAHLCMRYFRFAGVSLWSYCNLHTY